MKVITVGVILFNLFNLILSKCDIYEDITTGTKLQNGSILYNDIIFDRENYFQKGFSIMGCVCNIKICVRKCCPKGQKYIRNDQNCVRDEKAVSMKSLSKNIKVDSDVHIVEPIPNYTRNIIDAPDFGKFEWCNKTVTRKVDNLRITKSGELLLTSEHVTIKNLEFCVEYFDDLSENAAIVCETFDIVRSIGKFFPLLRI